MLNFLALSASDVKGELITPVYQLIFVLKNVVTVDWEIFAIKIFSSVDSSEKITSKNYTLHEVLECVMNISKKIADKA